jgi:homogentisate 1,2-dioxygenase
MYRATSSLEHGKFTPLQDGPSVAKTLNPNSYMWPTFPIEKGADWLGQKLIAANGSAVEKKGLAIWAFAIDKDMAERTAFSSLDGDVLIIPQAGALDIQTEMGKMLVRQNEIAVIPRAIRYRVTLPAGPTRGYICELFQGHFQLPDLGAIGSTGLANVRDFQIPTAHFNGTVKDNKAQAPVEGEWTIVSRLASQLWYCTQDHTPFDVVAWHGTNYPYKFDLARFAVMGNALFDEHDPSLYVVLTAPTNDGLGSSVVDFAIIPPRWQVSEDTLWLPYYHRNTMVEFYGPIINAQDPEHPLNSASEDNSFFPFGAGMNGGMTTHGANENDFQEARNADLKPAKLQDDGLTLFLLETEMPLLVSDWADGCAVKNFSKPSKGRSKM